MFTEFDRLAMTRALALAERGLETTHPNPRVGCVIAKGDRIIGEGFHERAGEPHAEVMALRSAKEPVAGATAYVTLEPCSHHGRTPPCVNALIEARIARVVFAVQDPNPRVSGQGADALLRAGITVEAGLLQNEATELNIGFMKRMKEGLPWVRVKLAMSLDGRTALANGASQWITGEPARADVQRWRARCSAVMTGVGTVLADDPQLNVRLAAFKGRQPLRVVLDARLRSPVGAKLFAGLGGVGLSAPGTATVGAGAVGDVLIFAATDGGLSATGGGPRAAAVVDPSALAGDMAELVNAFETSPTSVAARSDSVAGAVAVKADARTSVTSPAPVPVPPKAATAAPTGTLAASSSALSNSAAGASPASAAAPIASPARLTDGTTTSASAAAVSAPTAAPSGAAAVTASTPEAGGGASAAVAPGAAGVSGSSVGPSGVAAEAPKVAPPVLAAAGNAAGVAASSDDATWSGAALSGAVQVKREADVASGNGASTGVSEALASSAPVPALAAQQPSKLNGAASPASDNSIAPSSVAAPAPAVVPPSPSAQPSLPAPASLAPQPSPRAPASLAPQPSTPAPASLAPQPSTPAQASLAPQPSRQGSPAAQANSAASVSPVAQASPVSQGRPAVQMGAGAPKAAGKADSPAAFQARKAELIGKGVRIEEVPADEGFLDLFAVLKKLGDMEVNEVLVEAGPTLAGQLLTTFLVDELLLYVAPKLLGPQGRPLVNLPELQSLQDAWGFSLFDAKRFGDDLRLRMRPK